MELIAIFYEAAYAQDYLRLRAPVEEHQEKKLHSVKQPAKRAPKRTSPAKPAPTSKAKSKPLPAASSKPAAEAKSERAARTQAKPASAPKTKNGTGVSERQAAVLKGLRSLMDKQHRVEAKTAELAKASAVPLGSLHSILVSLEKKHMIKTERQGSPKHPAIYQVLETSRKATGTLNGAVHGKAASSQAAVS
jgi:hypothetical protein